MNCKKLQPSFIIIISIAHIGELFIEYHHIDDTTFKLRDMYSQHLSNIGYFDWSEHATACLYAQQHYGNESGVSDRQLSVGFPSEENKVYCDTNDGIWQIWLNLNQRVSFLFHPCLNAMSLLPYYNMYHTERNSCYGIHNMDCILFWPPTS